MKIKEQEQQVIDTNKVLPESKSEPAEVKIEVGKKFKVTGFIRIRRVHQGEWHGSRTLRENLILECIYKNEISYIFQVNDPSTVNNCKKFTLYKGSRELLALTELSE